MGDGERSGFVRWERQNILFYFLGFYFCWHTGDIPEHPVNTFYKLTYNLHTYFIQYHIISAVSVKIYVERFDYAKCKVWWIFSM